MRKKLYIPVLALILCFLYCGIALSEIDRECWDNDGDGYDDIVCGGFDCDDSNPDVNPGVEESRYAWNCDDGIDNDCDMIIDSQETTCDCHDADGDGFSEYGYQCGPIDCDDGDPYTYPGAVETCDHKDNNCDGNIDEGLTTIYYRDLDGDGYGNPNKTREDCEQPAGYVSDNTDCDDSDSEVNPGQEEVPGNGIDDNCDGEIDECLIKSATGGS